MNYKRALRGTGVCQFSVSDAPAGRVELVENLPQKSRPNDADAIFHTAQIFSALHQDENALQAYRAIYNKNPQNEAATKRRLWKEKPLP